MKTTIFQRSLRNSSLLLLLFEFNNFSLLKDIIDKSIYASGTPELQLMAVQYYCHLSLSVLLDQATTLLLEGVLVTWYGRISYIYTFWYNFDTFLCQFLEKGTSDRCLICLNQLLRFSGFSLYPLSFSFKLQVLK